jgi:hypothetical protein
MKKPKSGTRPRLTDLTLTPQTLVEWFVLRWNVELTFEEGRRHLGLETQRPWSDKAIVRTTPVCWGSFRSSA